MTIDISSNYIAIQGAKTHYLDVGQVAAPSVILLHGASFSGQIWRELGTVELCASQGYRVIALDLPGCGKSEILSTGSLQELLVDFFTHLQLNSPVLVAPSLSGGYSLPFILAHGEMLRGFVAVNTVGVSRFAPQLKQVEVPTLIIWGSQDRIISVEQADLLTQAMPNSRKIILENAGHNCYLDAPEEFNKHLLNFLKSLGRREFNCR
ncbi:MAG: alpha/beta hydrolase [Okeania sp. SIO2D1]|nr:alpha/beta hydrolase [Okeania sp. SIO2D1]